jgi:hypothetical protein
MIPNWRPLQDELAVWEQHRLSLPLWWRDDDAISATPQLDRLIALSDTLRVPVHLAVIPKTCDTSLVARVDSSTLIPVVHGWAHLNHAPKQEKKSEFRMHRSMPTIIGDARQGLDRLQELFGDRLAPMFVPPWNRIAPEVVAELPALGYRILSTATPRATPTAAPGLHQVNTHLDPIDWRGTRGLVSPERLIDTATALLRDRREGRSDNSEPFGILTHHLVHDDAIWAFTHDLLHLLLDGPGVPWTATNEIRRPE